MGDITEEVEPLTCIFSTKCVEYTNISIFDLAAGCPRNGSSELVASKRDELESILLKFGLARHAIDSCQYRRRLFSGSRSLSL